VRQEGFDFNVFHGLLDIPAGSKKRKEGAGSAVKESPGTRVTLRWKRESGRHLKRSCTVVRGKNALREKVSICTGHERPQYCFQGVLMLPVRRLLPDAVKLLWMCHCSMYKWLSQPRLLDPPGYLSPSNVIEPKKQMKKTAQGYRLYPWRYSTSARPFDTAIPRSETHSPKG